MIKVRKNHIHILFLATIIIFALAGCSESGNGEVITPDFVSTPIVEQPDVIDSSVAGEGTNPSNDNHSDGVVPFIFWTDYKNQSFVKYQCEDGSPSDLCGEVKEIGICLNCVGAKSPEMSDLFNHIGEVIMSCPEYQFPSDFGRQLFFGGELIPITSISQYNPNKLQDEALTAKFVGLCPYTSEEPVVIGIVDPLTRVIRQVSLVLCGSKIYPLTGATTSCEESAKEVMNYIEKAIDEKNNIQQKYDKTLENSEFIDLDYNVVPLSDFLEGQYVHCGKDSETICQKICNSKVSCILPLDTAKNLKSILSFNTAKLKVCDGRKIKFERFLSLIQEKETFVFSHLSLHLQYENVPVANDFHDFSVINDILNDFDGIFQTDRDWKEEEYRTFLFSPAYRNEIKTKLDTFCRPSESTFIMGHDGRGELAICQSDSKMRILVLAFDGEDCQVAGRRLEAFGPIIERSGQ